MTNRTPAKKRSIKFHPRHARSRTQSMREAYAMIDPDLIGSRLPELRATVFEGSDRHNPKWVQLVLEVAAGIKDREHAKEFANRFLNKPPEFTNTPAGIAALQFESWLAKHGEGLFARFLETIIDGDKLLIIFEGKLHQEKFERMRRANEEWIQDWQVKVKFGDIDYDADEVSELTMFEAIPVTGLKPPDPDDQKPPDSEGGSTDLKAAGREGTTPNVRGESEEEEVDERHPVTGIVGGGWPTGKKSGGAGAASGAQGARKKAALRRLGYDTSFTGMGMGFESRFEAASNRVLPTVVERASRQLDRVPVKARSLVRYALAQDLAEDGTCAWAIEASRGDELIEWIAENGGERLDDGAGLDTPAGSLRLVEGVSVGVVFCALSEAALAPLVARGAIDDRGQLREDACLESFHVLEGGACRSLLGSWAVFEAEDEVVLVAGAAAYAVDLPLDEVRTMLDTLARVYDDLPAEFDCTVQHALAEMGAEGRQIDDSAPIIENLSPDPEAIADRDAAVKRNAGLRRMAQEAENGKKPDEPEDETDDRMDEPEFYRDDLQEYFDLLMTLPDMEQSEAERKVKARFKIKELVVTAGGEVRSPGVGSRPGAMNQPHGEDPTDDDRDPDTDGDDDEDKDGEKDDKDDKKKDDDEEDEDEEDDEDEDEEKEKPKNGKKKNGKKDESVTESSFDTMLSNFAKRSGKPLAQVKELAGKAEASADKHSGSPAESSAWFRYKVGVLKRMLQIESTLTAPRPETGDQLFERFLDDPLTEDVAEFDAWVGDCYPNYMTFTVAPWQPRDVHEARSHELKERLPYERQEQYDKWVRLTNMRTRGIRSALADATTSGAVGGFAAAQLGRKSAKALLRMKGKQPQEWTETEWNWCGRQIKAIQRMRTAKGQLVDEHGAPTWKTRALRLWGHDPLAESIVEAGEVVVRTRTHKEKQWHCPHCQERIHEKGLFYNTESDEWSHRSCGGRVKLPKPDENAVRALHKWLECISGPPVQIVEYNAGKGPRWKALQGGKTPLSDEERERVMARKATWHHGPKGAASPAVWKSEVGDKTWYVTNTHRAYNVTPTLDGACGRYHAFIKSTA